MTNEERWKSNYEALKVHVLETGHFFNKHNKLCNWAKYQRKRIKVGTMPEEQRVMFEELEKMRSGEHTGGENNAINQVFSVK